MAQILAGILGITLKEAGKAIGLAIVGTAASQVFTAGLDKIGLGDSGAAELQKNMKQALIELQKVNEAIKQVGGQVVQARTDMKRDLVATYVTNITTAHDQYEAAMQYLLKQLEIVQKDPSQENVDELEAARERVTTLLKHASDSVYRDVTQMHVFLVGQGAQSLISLINDEFIKDSKDFLSYFCKMKATLVDYWTIEAKALALLTAAEANPDAGFTEGQALIAKVHANIVAQDTFFAATVPSCVLDLACAVLLAAADPSVSNARVSIDFRVLEKFWCHPGNETTNALFFGDSVRRWYLEPVQKDVAHPNVAVNYTFRLIEGSLDRDLILSGSQYRAVGESGNATLNDWRILPYKGRNTFRLQYVSHWFKESMNNYFLDAVEGSGNHLYYSEHADDNNPRQFFTIAPFVGEALYRNGQLRPDEPIIPGTYVSSPNKQYRLQMNPDGAVALHSVADNTDKWQSDQKCPADEKPKEVQLNRNGQLVATTQSGKQFWKFGQEQAEAWVHYYDYVVVTDQGKMEVRTKEGKVIAEK